MSFLAQMPSWYHVSPRLDLLLSLDLCKARLVLYNRHKPLGNPSPHDFAAAAKSLQSCPTLCDPIDSSPPGSTMPGILQARTWQVKSLSRVRQPTRLGCHCLLHTTLGCHQMNLTTRDRWSHLKLFLCSVGNPTLQPLDGCSRPEGPNRRTMFTQALKPPGTPSWVLPLPPTGYLCFKGKFQYSCTFRFCCRWDRGLGLLILPTWHYALRTDTLLGEPSLPEAMCILIWPVYPWGSCWFCEPWDIDLHFHTSPTVA